MSEFNDFLKEKMQNDDFKKEYDFLKDEFEEIQSNIDIEKRIKIKFKD